jgi:hypothetical protein
VVQLPDPNYELSMFTDKVQNYIFVHFVLQEETFCSSFIVPVHRRVTLLELLLLPWKEKRVFRGFKHGKDVISVNYPRKDFHGTFIARTNIISVEYHGDNLFPRN